ncbi:MAG: tetratricopeptide repeat protein [Gammaproteobacteria bacterium]|nr:tetratricopeptide repeat protein [Gammaproteobacteria bacterium]
MKKISKILALIILALPLATYADNAAGLSAINVGNYQEAFSQFKEAADQGDPAAQSNLGVMYDRGLGVKEDGNQALKLYQAAAKQGYADAMINMGSLYITGDKQVIKNVNQGIYWYKKAMKAGKIAEGAYSLGLIYYYGRGVEKNYSKAVKYFGLGTKHGHVLSTEMLGNCYLGGQGVKADYQLAYNYLYKAKLLGDQDANQGLAKLYAKLTPQQIQQLQAGTFRTSEVTITS